MTSASQLPVITSASPTGTNPRANICKRVIESGLTSKIPTHTPDDFQSFEDAVYGELVSRQLEWAMKVPGHEAAYRTFRALLLTTMSATDKVRLRA
jgi:hypothetical protein